MIFQKRDLHLLTAACALAFAPHMLHLPSWMTGCAGLLLLWRTWLTATSAKPPSRTVMVLLLVGIIAGVVFSYGTVTGKDANIAVVSMLLGLKLLEVRQPRDFYSSVFLAFFLLLTNFLYLQDLMITFAMAGVLVMLMASHISLNDAVPGPGLKERFYVSAKTLVLGLPIAAVLFLVFPRIDGPLWGKKEAEGRVSTGMTSTMSPGDMATLVKSTETAFVSKFSGITPEVGSLYWRGLTLSVYDGKTWRESAPNHEQQNKRPDLQHTGEPLKYQVIIDSNDGKWLYSLDAAQDVETDIPEYQTNIRHDLTLKTKSSITTTVAYTVTSFPAYSLDKNMSAADLAPYLQLPSGFNPRTAEFAKQMRAAHPKDEDLIHAFLEHINKNNFFYTTDVPAMGADVVDDFLFEKRVGFCEHYSNAFVVFMRNAGVPARVVVGYLGGKYNQYNDYVTVRQADAHAWAEVWIAGKGWKRFDPTSAINPSRVINDPGSANHFGMNNRETGIMAGLEGLGLYLKTNWHSANVEWNRVFLTYASNQQDKLLKSVLPSHMSWHWAAAPTLLVALALAWKFLPKWRAHRAGDAFEREYLKVCAKLARMDLVRAQHEGPTEYANRVSQRLQPAKQRSFSAFIEVYVKARYGRQSTKKELALLRELRRKI